MNLANYFASLAPQSTVYAATCKNQGFRMDERGEVRVMSYRFCLKPVTKKDLFFLPLIGPFPFLLFKWTIKTNEQKELVPNKFFYKRKASDRSYTYKILPRTRTKESLELLKKTDSSFIPALKTILVMTPITFTVGMHAGPLLDAFITRRLHPLLSTEMQFLSFLFKHRTALFYGLFGASYLVDHLCSKLPLICQIALPVVGAAALYKFGPQWALKKISKKSKRILQGSTSLPRKS